MANFPNLLYIRAQGVYSWQPSDSWVQQNVQSHGALGGVYPNKRHAIEGDTPAVLHTLSNGLHDPSDFKQAGWGGRFSSKCTNCKAMSPVSNQGQWGSYQMYQDDSGSIHSWNDAVHNDFAARMDWSVSVNFGDANHHPVEVENLHHAQGARWYAAGLKAYEPLSVSPNTLPYDHHELIGMIAPRAVLAIESSQIARMGAEAATADHLGARKIWDALGVSDRHGSSETNTGHCSFHEGSRSALEAFVDKFLLGDESVDTDILESIYTVDDSTWNPWDAPVLE